MLNVLIRAAPYLLLWYRNPMLRMCTCYQEQVVLIRVAALCC